jgi:hypothetical protein
VAAMAAVIDPAAATAAAVTDPAAAMAAAVIDPAVATAAAVPDVTERRRPGPRPLCETVPSTAAGHPGGRLAWGQPRRSFAIDVPSAQTGCG